MEIWPPPPTNGHPKPKEDTIQPEKQRIIGYTALGCSTVALSIIAAQIMMSETGTSMTEMGHVIESNLLYRLSLLTAGIGFALGIVSHSTGAGRIAILGSVCFFLLPFVDLMMHWYGVLPRR